MNPMNLIPPKVIHFLLLIFSFSIYFFLISLNHFCFFFFFKIVDGPLYYRGCDEDAIPFIEKRKIFEKNDQEEYCYYYNGITPDDSPYKKKKLPIDDRAPADSSEQEKDPKQHNQKKSQKQPQQQQHLRHHRGDEEKVDEETKEEPGHHHRRPLQLQNPDRSTHVISAASPSSAVQSKRSLTLDKDSLLLFMQMSYSSWKEFFSYCYRENPWLSFISLILLVVIYAFHPDLTKLVVPLFIGCSFLVAFMNE
jgi:hypothetical protein